VLRDFNKIKNKQFKNSLDELLPKSLIPYIIMRSRISPDKPVNSITKAEREKLVLTLKQLDFHIEVLGPIESGIVTAGGVCVSEINPKTMESKLVKNLFVVGEMLDVDAFTGGFNIQIALSTGRAAGNAIQNEV
jgi:predicted Rossmann fold flavoprotein